MSVRLRNSHQATVPERSKRRGPGPRGAPEARLCSSKWVVTLSLEAVGNASEGPERHEDWQQQRSRSPPRGHQSHPRSVPPALLPAPGWQHPQATGAQLREGAGRALGNGRSGPAGRRARLLRASAAPTRPTQEVPRDPTLLPRRPWEPSLQAPRRQGGWGFLLVQRLILYRPFIAFNRDADTKIHKIKRCSISKGKSFLNYSAQQKKTF